MQPCWSAWAAAAALELGEADSPIEGMWRDGRSARGAERRSKQAIAIREAQVRGFNERVRGPRPSRSNGQHCELGRSVG